MAVTHPPAVRDGICNFVVDQLDEGTPPGKLVFQTSADAEVATLTLANPAFSAAAGGIAVAGAILEDPDATGGIIAKARLRNAAGVDKITCSVTAKGGGGDIELDGGVSVRMGQQVALLDLIYSAPA